MWIVKFLFYFLIFILIFLLGTKYSFLRSVIAALHLGTLDSYSAKGQSVTNIFKAEWWALKFLK